MGCAALLCLSGLFIEGGVGYARPPNRASGNEQYLDSIGPRRPEPTYQENQSGRRYDIGYSANPMGNFAIGHEWDTVKWRVTIEFRHESWIGTSKDKGLNGAWTSVRYKPFAR